MRRRARTECAYFSFISPSPSSSSPLHPRHDLGVSLALWLWLRRQRYISTFTRFACSMHAKPSGQSPSPEPAMWDPGISPSANAGGARRGYHLSAGKIALVSGGDSGIGRAVCHCYVQEGATVAFTIVKGREDKDATDLLHMLMRAKMSNAKDPIAIAMPDLGYDETRKKVVDEMVNSFGRIDRLVNNAAEQYECSTIEAIDEARLERIFRTNIFAPFFMTRYSVTTLVYKWGPGATPLTRMPLLTSWCASPLVKATVAPFVAM
ncbi:hypothetical protein NL676_030778 [Syzygium grande]|nr:hypothetical protein NL676_030778 [Syzygium grande]